MSQPGGSYQSVVKGEKKEEKVFSLKLKGGQPKLADAKKDTSLGAMNEDEAMKRKGTLPKGGNIKDEIDDSL